MPKNAILCLLLLSSPVLAQEVEMAGGGWFAGVEAVIAKPHFEDGRDVFGDEPEFDYQASPRLFVGHCDCNGFGARARYWHYEQESSVGELPGPVDGTTLLTLQSLDVELTQQVCLGPMTATLFGGLKYADYQHDERLPADPEIFHDFQGFGPTLGIEATLPIGCTGWELFGGLRYSHLFGESEVYFDGNLVDPMHDDHGKIIESQLGARYYYCNSCGQLWVLKAAVETQDWIALAEGPVDIGDSGDDDLGLLAFVLGVEYWR